jgi:hypothetical protein
VQIYFLKWLTGLATKLSRTRQDPRVSFNFAEDEASDLDLEETSPPPHAIPPESISGSDLGMREHSSYDIVCTPAPSEEADEHEPRRVEGILTDFSISGLKKA